MAIKIKDLLGECVSRSCFKVVDGQMRVVGKWAVLEIVGEKVDITIFGSERKITSLIKRLPKECGFKRLTGEAYTQIYPDADLIKKHLPCLGIKRRKRLSDDAIAKLKERLPCKRTS